MAEKVGLGTRLRIFVISTGFVAAVAGGGAIYLTFFHNETAARVGVLEQTTVDHGQKLVEHTGVLEQHGQRLDGHDTTLGEHGSRLVRAEGTLAEHGTAIEQQAQAIDSNRARSEAAASAAADARADAARLGEALTGSEQKSATELAGLREEIRALRAKVQTLEQDQRSQLAQVLDRLTQLEAAAREKP